MPRPGLCRVDASRYASCLVGAVNVLTCSAYSEGFQEGQQRVWWPVAAGRGCWRRDSGEGFLLEGKVRVQPRRAASLNTNTFTDSHDTSTKSSDSQ